MINEREYYRVSYPVAERPVLSASYGQYDVMDVSEYGVRVALPSEANLTPGMCLIAVIRFHDGGELECYGEILRRDDDSIAVYLHKSIPLKRIYAESAYLRRIYRARFEDEGPVFPEATALSANPQNLPEQSSFT